MVPPVYDQRPSGRHIINLGVGVNLKVAPNFKKFTQPTTSLKHEGIDIDIPEFMKKFDERFAFLVARSRKEKNLEGILRRMNFLDAAGKMTLRRKIIRNVIVGKFKGFSVKRKKAFIHISHSCCAVHGYKLKSRPCRILRKTPHLAKCGI
jgi:biotin-(acetyl-CoA carboxylase) ligase